MSPQNYNFFFLECWIHIEVYVSNYKIDDVGIYEWRLQRAALLLNNGLRLTAMSLLPSHTERNDSTVTEICMISPVLLNPKFFKWIAQSSQ